MNAIYTRPVAVSSTGKTYNRYQRIREGRGFRTGDLQGPFFIHVTYDGKQKWPSCKPRPSKPQSSKLAWALRLSRRSGSV